MKKILYILNVANRVNSFSFTSMKAAQELGYDYHIAGNWSYKSDQERIADEKKYNIHIYQIDFVRTPYHPGNIKAYKQLKEIVKRERFDVIHCNTPIGGVVGRIVGRRCKTPVVLYQAHGFHFYKGAPMINWIIYYPIELWLAHYTDALITINHEDYQRAQSFKLRNNGKIYYVPGVGIDVDQYQPRNFDRNTKRLELGLVEDDVAIISAGDLIERKNYKASIEAIAKTQNRRIHYFICGEGPEKDKLETITIERGISDQIHFIGFRNDIKELMWASDIFLFTTLQEGLPRSLSEAMACGLPCIVSNVRGNSDLMQDQSNALLVEPNDTDGFAVLINKLVGNAELRRDYGKRNAINIRNFDIETVKNKLKIIYDTEVKN